MGNVREGQTKTIASKGLYTNPNPLAVSDETFTLLDNVVMDRSGMPRSRRGFKAAPGSPPATAEEVFNIIPFHDNSADVLFVQAFLAGQPADDLYLWNSGTWTHLGQHNSPFFQAPTNPPRIYGAASNGNLYVATADGILSVDTTGASALRASGALKALGFDPKNSYPTVNGDGAGIPNQLANGFQAAYRVTMLYRDAAGNVIEGAPSGRYVASNTDNSAVPASAAHAPKFRVVLPAEATTSWWFRVYRSAFVFNGFTNTFGGGSVPFLPYQTPSDDMQLVYENPLLGSTDISNGYVDFTDIAPDNLRGSFLYTSPNAGLGILASNDPPPLALDVATFKGRVFAANITSRHRLNLTLLSIQLGGSGPGIQTGDTITIAGVVYTFGATQDPSTNKVQLVTGSSLSIDIEQTARNLVSCINQSAQSGNTRTIYAFYSSGPFDLPGKILLESRTPGGSAFTAIASARGSSYQPNLAAAQSSAAERSPHKVAISQFLQPEAFPPTQSLAIGSADSNIVRLFPLRDGVLVFKDGNGGVYKITGDDVSNFRVSPVDLTLRIVAQDSIGTIDNMVYFLSAKGVCRGNLNGFELIDGPVHTDIQQNLVAKAYGSLLSFAVASETDKRYILFYPSIFNECRFAYVFNIETSEWNTWTMTLGNQGGYLAGVINPADNKIYLGFSTFPLAGGSGLMVERKDYAATDYREDQDLSGSNSNKAIKQTFQWRAFAGDEPMNEKQWREILLVFTSTPTSLTLQFSTEDATPSPINVSPVSRKVRVDVPLEAQRSETLNVQVTHSVVSEDIQLQGLRLLWNEYGERVTR